MSLFRTERPSRDKERAIISVQEKKRKMGRIGILIPADLKEKLKINAAKHDIPYTDIVLSLIEKYLKTEEQKEG
jgi:predicted DNA binding CopG/RHH family protein